MNSARPFSHYWSSVSWETDLCIPSILRVLNTEKPRICLGFLIEYGFSIIQINLQEFFSSGKIYCGWSFRKRQKYLNNWSRIWKNMLYSSNIGSHGDILRIFSSMRRRVRISCVSLSLVFNSRSFRTLRFLRFKSFWCCVMGINITI